ncbi:hypothetical protein D051_2161 [Vibrio parahaemolyticus VPCR-2010]|nr:hypothetical protein D051_2161 [Vibrio parahaemolyticus VPCR-2010]
MRLAAVILTQLKSTFSYFNITYYSISMSQVDQSDPIELSEVQQAKLSS